MKKTANNFILYIIFIHYYYQYRTILHVKEHAVEEKTFIKCEHKQEKKSVAKIDLPFVPKSSHSH